MALLLRDKYLGGGPECHRKSIDREYGTWRRWLDTGHEHRYPIRRGLITNMKLIITLLLTAASLCFGQGRPIDFTASIIGIDGKPMMNGDPKVPVALTLGEVAVTALESQLEEDKQATGADKFKRDELARKIYGKKDVALPAEEIATIKDRIGKSFGAMVVGAAWRMLDPASDSAKK